MDLSYSFCLKFVMPLWASVNLFLVSPAGKGLTTLLSFVVYNCDCSLFH